MTSTSPTPPEVDPGPEFEAAVKRVTFYLLHELPLPRDAVGQVIAAGVSVPEIAMACLLQRSAAGEFIKFSIN